MAITTDIIISVDDFRYFIAGSESIDAKILTPMIILAQDLAAQNVLGTALKDKLVTDVNDGTLTGDYETLYDSSVASVKKMVVWQTFESNLSSLVYKIGKEAITIGDTDEVSSIGREELGDMKREASSKRAFYENQVKSYLSNNQSSFSELQDTTPDYIQSNLTKTDTSMGMSWTTNNVFNNF